MQDSALWKSALTLVFLAAITPHALADPVPFDYSNPFGDYGTVSNFFCPLDGICGADEAINSFVFLDTYYPGVYGTGSLIPGNDPNRDALWLAGTPGLSGWTGPNGPRQGYYNRTGGGGNPDQILQQTMEDWANDWAPGTTTFTSMIGSVNGFPTINFLADEMSHHEDVELIVDIAGDGAHALSLTDIACDNSTPPNCSIRYQDPNNSAAEQSANLFNSPTTPGELGFYYADGSANAFIRSAIGDSPVPEPSTWALFATGLAGLSGYRSLRNKRT